MKCHLENAGDFSQAGPVRNIAKTISSACRSLSVLVRLCVLELFLLLNKVEHN